MSNDQYMEMLWVLDDCTEPIIVSWSNGLKVKCRSITEIFETSLEPGDEDYVGEYVSGVKDVEILEKGKDASIEIYEKHIEISLISIPELIAKADGTVLWQKK